ncbi:MULTISPECIES: hypothetical protein [unclassified Streptomyces]|uniref:hypothetical protein n=1 Tax=unclassified Streptomyces TaxID=2593676 RepID=UPI0004C9AC68|nr:hypothetical protein [Streptomyces sp. NRRL F-2747]
MNTTFTRTPAADVNSVDVSMTPTALPVLSAEERGCSCIYCFKAKETFIEPPMRYTDDAQGSGR